MERKMKDSGIEWVGAIPEDWKIEKLQWNIEEIVEKNSPIKMERVLSLTKEKGVIPYDEKGNQGNKSKENLEEYKIAYKDTIVANSMNILIGSVGISKYDGCVSPVYYVFKNNEKSDLRFLNYIFSMTQFQKQLRKYANGILEIRLRVSSENIKKQLVAMPDVKEQEKIADYLDEKIPEMDAIISKTKESIEQYKKYKQAVITDVVTRGIASSRAMKDSGNEWIGEIPVEWSISRIKFVADFEPSSDKTGLDENSIITYTPMECIKNGWFINNTAPFGSVFASLTAYQEGDIVMAKVTPCFENGNIAIMENLSSGFGLGSSELFVFRTNNIEKAYLFYWLRNNKFIQSACSTMTGTGGLKRVSSNFVKNCYIHIPPVAEQIEIAKYLDEKCAEIDALIAKKEAFVEELEGYKQSLIYEYVTGKKEVL